MFAQDIHTKVELFDYMNNAWHYYNQSSAIAIR